MARKSMFQSSMMAAVILFGLVALAQPPGGPGGGDAPGASVWGITTPDAGGQVAYNAPISGTGTAPNPNLAFAVKVIHNDDGVFTEISSDSGTTNGQPGNGGWSATCPVPASGEFPTNPEQGDFSNTFRLFSAEEQEASYVIYIVDNDA